MRQCRLEVDGVSVTAGFTLEHAGGFVVFDNALAAGDEVEVSGKALELIRRAVFN